MTIYALYLESGPRRRKTQVHVLDLLGCVAQGPTTEEALAATPDAIRAYLRFLQRHGDAVGPEGPFSTAVVAHVIEGPWLGNGDPAPGFAPDFQPLSSADLATYLQRLAWLQADLVALLRAVPPEQLAAEPDQGRPILRILEHIAQSHYAYLHNLVGKVEGASAILKAVEQGGTGLPALLARLWQLTGPRLAGMTEVERSQMVPHGQVTWSARRGMRRMLEHLWEHEQEIAGRLTPDV
ncbi:MAG: hypothetical protein EXR62_06240 [Chloroflexi bacterium]|nr:hypothetical protein [Chloroflexota bacterium]